MSRTRFKRTERIPVKHLGKRLVFLEEVAGVGVVGAVGSNTVTFVARSNEWVHCSLRRLLRFNDTPRSPKAKLLKGATRDAYSMIARVYQFSRERSLVGDALEDAVHYGRIAFERSRRVEIDKLDADNKIVKAFDAAERHWRAATNQVILKWKPELHGFTLK